MKKIFLSLLFAMFAVVPAMATPSHTASTFPLDELMQADYTYNESGNIWQ